MSRVRVSRSLPHCLSAWSTGFQKMTQKILGPGLGYECHRLHGVMGPPAFWKASMNEVNVTPVLLLLEYVSSCSLGSRSKRPGSSLSSHCRQRESPFASQLSMRRVFTFLNELRSLNHSMRSTSLCSSDDKQCASCSRVRCSTAENIRLSELAI